MNDKEKQIADLRAELLRLADAAAKAREKGFKIRARGFDSRAAVVRAELERLGTVPKWYGGPFKPEDFPGVYHPGPELKTDMAALGAQIFQVGPNTLRCHICGCPERVWVGDVERCGECNANLVT